MCCLFCFVMFLVDLQFESVGWVSKIKRNSVRVINWRGPRLVAFTTRKGKSVHAINLSRTKECAPVRTYSRRHNAERQRNKSIYARPWARIYHFVSRSLGATPRYQTHFLHHTYVCMYVLNFHKISSTSTKLSKVTIMYTRHYKKM